ncbi:MAG TPA: RNA 2',3'-cyclic phosphodiesterase [Steroidobacteraceae bacterium]|nr:RNA 2',3'-cyclic phosphodiesterase [Steroidobacteraceae bacterium]
MFFALWPDEGAQEELARAVAGEVADAAGRGLPPRNLHATLAFLGSVPQERLGELASLAREVAAAWPGGAPGLRFRQIEHWARVSILVVTAEDEDERAHALARALKDACVRGGFAPDLKPFRAHVTVARKVMQARAARSLPELTWRFTSFALIESDTRPGGSVYSVRESFVLGKTQKVPD